MTEVYDGLKASSQVYTCISPDCGCDIAVLTETDKSSVCQQGRSDVRVPQSELAAAGPSDVPRQV
jgi:hypothetical protein